MSGWGNPLEALERRTLFASTGAIVGRVFIDTNANGVRDSAEVFLPFGHVFFDNNRNGIRDFNEPSAAVVNGKPYHFNDVAPGTYRVAFAMVTGYLPFQAGGYNVTVRAGQTLRRTIPVIPPGIIQGNIFTDTNSNGVRDPGEPIAPRKVTVYLDLNNDLQFEIGEPFSDSTSYLGGYLFRYVPAGRYSMRAMGHGQVFTTPHAYTTTVAPNGSVTKSFGVAP